MEPKEQLIKILRFIRRLPGTPRRFFWWVSSGCSEHLSVPNMPGWQRKFYAVLGAFICATALPAFGAWFHQGLLLFGGEPHSVVKATGLGVAAAAIIFGLEQLIVMTVRPPMSGWARWRALFFRSVPAVTDSTILIVPMLLACFPHWISLTLRTEQRDAIHLNRAKIEQALGLGAISKSIDSSDTSITNLLKARSAYPVDVQQALSARDDCEHESVQLQATLRPPINAELAEVNRLKFGYPFNNYSRLEYLHSEIASARAALKAKQKVCNEISTVARNAVASYLRPIDSQLRNLQKKRDAFESESKITNEFASAERKLVEEAIAQNAQPDLGAQIRALIELVFSNGIAFGVACFGMVLSYTVFMTPVLVKLSARSSDPLVTATAAQTAAFTAEVNSQAAIRRSSADLEQLHANASLDGYKQFVAEGGTTILAASWRERALDEQRRANLQRDSEYIKVVLDTLERSAARIAGIPKQSGAGEIKAELDDLRRAVREMIRRATHAAAPQSPGQPAE